MAQLAERIELEAPLDGAFQPVIRMIIGGIAERVDFGFEEIDDLQLAVERLLAEGGYEGSVRLSFEVGDGSVRARCARAPSRRRSRGRSPRRGTSPCAASCRPWSTRSASRRRRPARSSCGSRS